MKNKKRRILPVAIALVAIVALSGVAYAYWSSSGTGSGSATTGTSAALTASQTNEITGMVPDSVHHAVDVRVHNGAGFSQSFKAVVISVNAASLPVGCDAGWFSVGSPTASLTDIQIAANGDSDVTGGWIAMDESGTNQDACKTTDPLNPVTIGLTFTVS